MQTLFAEYRDTFIFILLSNKVNVYLGSKGNRFISNGKLKNVNAEEIHSVLTTPASGKGVIYDVPNANFMRQKKVCCIMTSQQISQTSLAGSLGTVYCLTLSAPLSP